MSHTPKHCLWHDHFYKALSTLQLGKGKIVSNNGKSIKAVAKPIEVVIRHQHHESTMVWRDVREDDPVYQVLFEEGHWAG